MTATDDRSLVALRKYAVLLDSAFQVPGTRLRFGLDPIVGLVPWAGDLVTGFFSVMIVVHAVRLHVPKVVIARMLLNSGLDLLTGVVPLLGDLFDATFKANLRNLALLERHAQPGITPTRSDYVFVTACILILVAVVAVPMAVAWWLLSQINWF
ncbi:MAG TPA: DUF4112 domain-containing protein [Vicinamibacterales bacterium]|nr:DUF4112 domain-containing protein [Vicinamibacterales bacterium]